MAFTPAISAQNVHVRYEATVALDGVSLEVGEGEVFALIGPNGAGKTTLVRCLTGTKRPDAGAVRLVGRAPQETDPANLGVLPQNFSPPERLSPHELVTYYGGLYEESLPPSEVLRTVGLEAGRTTRYAHLSGGERRRVDLAIALVNSPSTLFLDEPTTGIDPKGRREIWSLIEELAGSGTTIFLTTHYMEEAEELAGRVGLLADGRLVATGTPNGLIDRYGGSNRLIIETRDETDWVGPFPYRAEVRSEGVTVTGIRPREIGEVAKALQERGIRYESLRWRRPDLEDVFLRLSENGPPRSTAA